MDPEDLETVDIGSDDSEIDAAFAEAFRRSEEGDTETPTDEVTPDDESAAEAEQETEEETTVEEEPADDDVSAFLEKYGGDPEKALRGALELQKLQGRQADELGQLRQELAEIRAAQQRPEAPQVAQFPITQEFVEALDQQTLENPQAALARAADADPSGQLVGRVLSTWWAVDPSAASLFQTSMLLRDQETRIRSEYAPLVQKDQASEADRVLEASWSAAREHVAKSGVELNSYAPAMEAYLAENEGMAKAILAAETVAERATLISSTYEIVAAREASRAALQAEGQKQIKAEETAAKKAAKVIKPSAVGSAPGARADEVSEEDRIKAGVLGARNTDIASGWSTE